MIYNPVTPTKAKYAAWHTIRQDEIEAEHSAPKARVEASPPKAAPATPVYFTRHWHKTGNGGNEAARLRTPKGEYSLCVFNSKSDAVGGAHLFTAPTDFASTLQKRGTSG